MWFPMAIDEPAMKFIECDRRFVVQISLGPLEYPFDLLKLGRSYDPFALVGDWCP